MARVTGRLPSPRYRAFACFRPSNRDAYFTKQSDSPVQTRDGAIFFEMASRAGKKPHAGFVDDAVRVVPTGYDRK